MTIFTLSHAGHRAVIHRGSGKVEANKAHKRYTVIDPYEIRDKLLVAGFTTPRIYFNRPGNVAFIEAQDPSRGYTDSKGDRFHGLVKFKFDHRGKSSIWGQCGALRMACDNQFHNPPMKIHHCSEDARLFAQDPAVFAWELLKSAREPVEKLDALRGEGNGWVFVQEIAKTLGKSLRKKFVNASVGYRMGNTLDNWGAMQALTHTQSPALVRLASRLLADHWNTMALGGVPQFN